MIGRAEIEEGLRAVGGLADEAIDLAEAALALAALDRPRVSLERYRRHLERLGREVAEAAGEAAELEGRVALLNEVFFARCGYHGDTLTYDDGQNANLMRVIDRRKGLPVALGILYIHAARAQGWDIVGLNFPSHFLVRMAAGGRRAVLDPFHGGAEIDAGGMRRLLKARVGAGVELDSAFYAPVDNRGVLLRLQNNIKLRALRRDDVRRAVEVLRGMVLIAPAHAPSWRELGYLEAQLGDLERAIAALGRFVASCDGPRERHEAAVLIQRLEARLD